MADSIFNPNNSICHTDLPQPEKELEFLEEPIPPNREDYKLQENYDHAKLQYEDKLRIYTTRKQWLKEQKTQEENKTIEYPTYATFCPIINDKTGQRAPFKPAMVAIWLFEHDHFKTDEKTDILFFGDIKTGRWTENGEIELKRILAKIMGEENKECHYRNILHDLKSLTYTEITFSQKIACENCLLDPETQTVTPFNLEEMTYHEIPVKYDPTATCPKWEAFIKSVVNPDDLATIQEWSGYLLLPDYRFHKLLWIHGEGRNGKGVWERTMENILGEKNTSSIGLEEFDGNHRFALKQLFGKLFNPCSEPSTQKELQTPLLKKATGQDTIEAEIKGKQSRLKFRNCSKITVLANKFPKVRDNSTAFRERRLFIKFPTEFTGQKCIQNIEDNWLKTTDERSGILNWMLQGLKRLLDQGCFTESKTQQETEAEFLRASDTIGAFLAELCYFNKEAVTSRAEAYEAYKNYCDILGLDAENEKKFTGRLKETPRVKVGYIRTPRQERAWKGFSIRSIDEEGNIYDESATAATPATGKGVSYPLDIFVQPKNNGDISRVVNVAPVAAKEIWHFKPLSTHDIHVCDNPQCSGAGVREAVCKQVLNDEQILALGKTQLFFCKECFAEARAKAEATGEIQCVLDLPSEVQD
jgi:putative DNA primase/helicase